MKKILFGVLCNVIFIFLFAASSVAVTEIHLVPDIHRKGEDGFFQITLNVPEKEFSEYVFIIPRVVKGDILMMPSAVQSDSGKNKIIITGRYKKPGRAQIDIYRRLVSIQKNNRASMTQSPETSQLATISFDLPDHEVINTSVVTKWADQYQKNLNAYSIMDSFPGYWNSVIAPQFGLPASAQKAARNRDQIPDLYSIFTGAAAIQESLQLEALGDQRNAVPSAGLTYQYPIGNLSGPAVKSHPFPEMLKGRNPKLPRLSYFIPADQYAVFFSDINKEIELSDLMEEWGGNLLQQVDIHARDFHVKEKIIGQLCLEQTLLTRMFGDKVIGEVAVTGQDPFLKEGTAVTVLFHLKDKDLFSSQISKRFRGAIKEKGAALSELSVSGKKVIALTTADRRVSSFWAQWDNLAVISTSKEALERIVATQFGNIKSLAESDDFRYMRTIFVQDSSEEDIFIYFSDPHIRSLVGPRWKIGEARRLRCAANMLLISNARLWFLAEKKREPTLDELLKGDYLGKRPPECPEHGMYDLDVKTGEVFCSLHNRVGLLTPVGEIPMTHVTFEENSQYKEFVDNYNRYWTKYFDPIGIRIKMGDTIKMQTCILPLIENSWYDGLVRLAGNRAGTINQTDVLPRTVISLRGDIDTGWLRRERVLEELAKQDIPILQYLDGEISLNLCDGPVLFTPGKSVISMLVQEAGRNTGESLFFGFLLSALNLPTYLTVKVKEPARVEKLIPEMASIVCYGFCETPYIIDHEGKTPIYTIVLNVVDIVKLRFYSAIVGDRLVIASRRDIITDLLSGKPLKAVAHTGSFEMSVYREAFHELEPVVNLGYQEDLRQTCHNNFPLLNVMLKNLNLTPELTFSKIQSLRGYELYCPSGGKYFLDDHGVVTCSLHGNRLQPKQPYSGDEKSATYQLVNSLERINARLSFIPEGLMTEVEIKRKPRQKNVWYKKIFQ